MFASLLAFGLIASIAAQVPSTASASELALVDAQYANSGLAAATNTGFGVPLTSTALLTVTYGFGNVVHGEAYTVEQVTDGPNVQITPSAESASSFSASSAYTLMLADAASLGDPDLEGNYRHFLTNGLTGVAGAEGNTTFEPVDGRVITSYAAPGPIYAWLLFTQPATFAAPAGLDAPGVAPGHWNVSSYVESTGLTLVAASFFTVQNGQPTGSVVATTAAETSVAATTSAASTTRAASGTPAATTKAATAGAPTSTTTPSGAGKVVASLLAGIVGVVGAVVLV